MTMSHHCQQAAFVHPQHFPYYCYHYHRTYLAPRQRSSLQRRPSFTGSCCDGLILSARSRQSRLCYFCRDGEHYHQNNLLPGRSGHPQRLIGATIARRSNHNDRDEYSMAEQLYDTLFTSSSKNSAIFYQILLSILIFAFKIPVTTGVVAIVLYTVFALVATRTYALDDDAEWNVKGRRRRQSTSDGDVNNGDDDSRPAVYLLAFVGALVTAGILTPLNTTVARDDGSAWWAVVALGLATTTIAVYRPFKGEDDTSDIIVDDDDNYTDSSSDSTDHERKLMEMWDEDFGKLLLEKENVENDDKRI